MLWAALVAGGVAIVSMAIFGARLTRRPDDAQHDEIVPAADADDPWAAWQPRPFEELDRPPRPRLWPVLASLTGLVLVGGGLAGSRQSIQQPALASDTTPEPYLIEVELTPTPTPVAVPTPTPPPATPRPTAAAQVAAQTAAPQASTAAVGAGPTISGSASCSAGKVRVSFTVTGRGAQLSYVGIYLDGKIVGGGPVTSDRYQATIERTAGPGPHDVEVSAQDKAGKTARRQWRVQCG